MTSSFFAFVVFLFSCPKWTLSQSLSSQIRVQSTRRT